MKHKQICLLAALLCLLCMPTTAFAQSDTTAASVCAGYWTDGTLYAFAHFPQGNAEDQMISLMVNNQVCSDAYAVPITESDAAVHYLFLVDISTSTSQYRSFVTRFAEALLASAASHPDITIATFDREFQVLESGLTEPEAVQNALWSLRYQRDGSDISGGVASALAYLANEAHSAGDLWNLILFTDGEPWYSNDPTVEQEQRVQRAQVAAAWIQACSEVAVHTICFQSWDAGTSAALLSGRGMHWNASTSASAAEAGKELAAFSDSLYSLQFSLPGYETVSEITDSMLLGMGNVWVSVGALRNLSKEPSVAAQPLLPDPPQETSPVDPAAEASDSAETPEQTTAPDQAAPEHTEPPTQAAEILPDNPDSTLESGRKNVLFIAAIAGVPVLLAVLLIIFFCLRKRQPPRDSVRMRVEVISGNTGKLKPLYFLQDSLTIGSKRTCDIVVLDSLAAPINTRIFMQDQMIYIEDMHSPCGTTLNGMRIYSSNRLRSGDQIGISSVTLRFLF